MPYAELLPPSEPEADRTMDASGGSDKEAVCVGPWVARPRMGARAADGSPPDGSANEAKGEAASAEARRSRLVVVMGGPTGGCCSGMPEYCGGGRSSMMPSPSTSCIGASGCRR